MKSSYQTILFFFMLATISCADPKSKKSEIIHLGSADDSSSSDKPADEKADPIDSQMPSAAQQEKALAAQADAAAQAEATAIKEITNSVVGSWRKNCQDKKTYEVIFTDTTVKTISETFTDENCSPSNINSKLETTFTWKLQNSKPVKNKQFNVGAVYTSAKWTLFNDIECQDSNRSAIYGIKTWKKGEAQDILDLRMTSLLNPDFPSDKTTAFTLNFAKTENVINFGQNGKNNAENFADFLPRLERVTND
ncbi:MAG: hypothetical protein EOP04_02685 [Proteobacteria bacterium]|nr:MAG: hypothetical protein EOP04_02685 [Pseudomonadota bacterium]